jgi:hypothetical protein
MNNRFGSQWDEPQDGGQGFEEPYQDIFERRTHIGNREVQSEIAGTRILSDGRRGMTHSGVNRETAALDCGCVFTDEMQVRQTPLGALVCASHLYVCANINCGKVVEPLPTGQGVYLPHIKRVMHRHPCGMEYLVELLWSIRLKKFHIELEPDALLQLRMLHSQLKGEQPGLFQRIRAALTGKKSDGHVLVRWGG